MFLSYDGIVFDVLLLNGWDKTAIWSDDGTDFLYWHHLIDVTCILNPDVVAGSIMPPLIRARLNAQHAQGVRDAVEARRKADAEAERKKLIPPGGTLPGKPPRTNIPPDPKFGPRRDINPYEYTSKSAYVGDDGDNMEGAIPGVANHPLLTGLDTGSRYANDLANQTGPLEAVGMTIHREYSSDGVYVSPGVFRETSAGKWASDPASQLPFTRYTPVAFSAPHIPKIDPNKLPPPKGHVNPPQFETGVTLRPPPPPVERRHFPGNHNMPATDAELRDRLQVPRRPFRVWINSGPGGDPEYILSLPYTDCQMDAKDGPRCIKQHIHAIHGNVTGVQQLVFECYEALPPYYKTPGPSLRTPDNAVFENGLVLPEFKAKQKEMPLNPPLLSNRWTMRQQPNDESFLNTLIIEGKAIFRLDILSNIGCTADQLRTYIMPPLCLGYTRRPVIAVVGSRGDEFTYTVVDDQVMMNNPGGMAWGIQMVTCMAEFESHMPVDVIARSANWDREDRKL